jgi:hypothetical protein
VRRALVNDSPPDARPAAGHPAHAVAGPARRLVCRARAAVGPLFPAGPAPAARSAAGALAVLAGRVLAAVAAAGVLLLRQAGHPAWQTAWAEDKTVFLPRALLDPWGSFLHHYGGYVQLVPQLVADVVARFPLADAAVGFAVAGAGITAGCALFGWHASAGHIRRPGLRVVLAASVVLLPVAVVEVANSGVDAQWYLMYALFWALLWRPASRGGAVAAGLAAFLAMASNILNLLYLPLVAVRVVALPRWREHAVTAGWLAGAAFQLAGIMVQVPAILLPGGRPQQFAPLSATLGFYGQHVLAGAVAGWRLAPRLVAAAGLGGTVAACGGVLLVAGSWAAVRGGRRVRLFLAAAALAGLVLTVFPATIRFWVTVPPAAPLSQLWLPGSRYTVCAILLLDAAALVAVDACLRRLRWQRAPGGRAGRWPGGWRWPGWRQAGPLLAAITVLAVLGAGWVTSYRYPNLRSTGRTWAQITARFGQVCRDRPPGASAELFPWDSPQARVPLPCSLAGAGRPPRAKRAR